MDARLYLLYGIVEEDGGAVGDARYEGDVLFVGDQGVAVGDDVFAVIGPRVMGGHDAHVVGVGLVHKPDGIRRGADFRKEAMRRRCGRVALGGAKIIGFLRYAEADPRTLQYRHGFLRLSIFFFIRYNTCGGIV